MTEEAKAWIRKAEADLRMAKNDLQTSPDPNLDGICFHCQQTAEKLLKALLVERNVAFPRTHDLGLIAQLVIPSDLALTVLHSDLVRLSRFAVAFRYPGSEATSADALQ
jgi:HEPN domain-containing protein